MPVKNIVFIMLGSVAAVLPAIGAGRPQKAASAQSAGTQRPIRLTLVLRSEWNEDSSVHFSIYNDIRNEGVESQRHQPAVKGSAFQIVFSDTMGRRLDSAYIVHPLKEVAEVLNDQGKMAEKLFIKEMAYTEVHINYTSDMKKLLITDLSANRSQSLDIR